RALEIRNLAGKNGNFNVRCHQLNRPSFLVEVRTSRFLVRAGRLTLNYTLIVLFITFFLTLLNSYRVRSLEGLPNSY
ncbi:hypothetical protein NEUTE2DRAFT_71731, partial [Neurospora tetrasperma FGSC 2509]